MDNRKCIKCQMPIDGETECKCEPQKCFHCCECDLGCECGCKEKDQEQDNK